MKVGCKKGWTATTTMATTKLQTLTTFWQEFDLPRVQRGLDDVATDITARQDESEASRKALIDLMREFKKGQDESVRAAVAPLIKSFQNEVDFLSKRSKAAEKAFFEAYKKFTDIADPVPVLEHSLEAAKGLGKVADMEIEIKQLRETIGDYNNEITDYKAKERKMHELQAKVDAYDKNIDETLAVRVREVEARMLEEYNEKLAAVEDGRAAIQKKSEETEVKLRSTQKQLKEAQDQLFEALDGTQERSAARTEETEILLEDLERANARAAAAEKEAEAAKEVAARAREEAAEAARGESKEVREEEKKQTAALARELASKDREVEHLLSDLAAARKGAEEAGAAAAAELAELRRGREEADAVIGGLEARLQSMADYEAVKRDLAIMRSMEFGEAAPGSDEASAEGFDETGGKRPLEVMILERSKALQTENTTLRVERDRAESGLAVASREAAEKSAEAERLAELVRELEEHVERLQELSKRGEAEGRSSADILVDALDPAAGTPAALEPLLGLGTSPDNTFEMPDPSADSSKALLPIVQAQRERFKQRNQELEEEQARHLEQVNLLQTEVQDLRSDNVKLYEKIRFLQGFGGRHQGGGADTIIPVESRYKSGYEQKLDPFASFSAQERQRRYGQLSVLEKVILGFVRFIMANKVARLFFFAYSVLLHLMVFMVLMRVAYTDSYRRDLASEWHDKYMQHMEDAHGPEEHQDGGH